MDCFNPILQVTLGWLPYVSHNIYRSGEVRLLQFTQYIWWVIPMNIVYPMDVDPHIVASYKCILFQELTFSWVHTSYSYSKSLVVSVSTVMDKEYRLPGMKSTTELATSVTSVSRFPSWHVNQTHNEAFKPHPESRNGDLFHHQLPLICISVLHICTILIYITIWLFNIAMENHHF